MTSAAAAVAVEYTLRQLQAVSETEPIEHAADAIEHAADAIARAIEHLRFERSYVSDGPFRHQPFGKTPLLPAEPLWPAHAEAFARLAAEAEAAGANGAEADAQTDRTAGALIAKLPRAVARMAKRVADAVQPHAAAEPAVDTREPHALPPSHHVRVSRAQRRKLADLVVALTELQRQVLFDADCAESTDSHNTCHQYLQAAGYVDLAAAALASLV